MKAKKFLYLSIIPSLLLSGCICGPRDITYFFKHYVSYDGRLRFTLSRNNTKETSYNDFIKIYTDKYEVSTSIDAYKIDKSIMMDDELNIDIIIHDYDFACPIGKFYLGSFVNYNSFDDSQAHFPNYSFALRMNNLTEDEEEKILYKTYNHIQLNVFYIGKKYLDTFTTGNFRMHKIYLWNIDKNKTDEYYTRSLENYDESKDFWKADVTIYQSDVALPKEKNGDNHIVKCTTSIIMKCFKYWKTDGEERYYPETAK